MSAPVRLEALTLAHDPTDPSSSALALRRDAATTVTLPEWRRAASVNPEDSPVSYAVARLDSPAVLAQVRRLEPTLAGGQLRAGPSSPLGSVESTTVAFAADDDLVTVRATVSHQQLGLRAPDVFDVIWQWQWRTDPADDWDDLDETELRVYVLLDVPTAPWQQSPADAGNVQLPWTTVLDHACRWARGAGTAGAAAAQITQAVYDLAPELIEYGCPILAATQYSTPSFDCTAFLDRLRGGLGNGRYVNCTDCATIVSTFANALGCDLWQSTMWTLAADGKLDPFFTNEIVAIGASGWSTPCGWLGFNYHEVAWTGDCGVNDEVYDACLLVDGDGDPVDTPHVPLLSTGLRFGNPDELEYRARLATPAGRAKCAPQPQTRQRRAIM
jgi:hypothetical protein